MEKERWKSIRLNKNDYRRLTNTHGVLVDPCETGAAPPCDLDQNIFKGIFARNLRWRILVISQGKIHQVLDLIGPQVPDGHICRLKETHILLIPEPEHRLPQAELDVWDLDEEQLPLPPGLPQWRARLPGHWWFPTKVLIRAPPVTSMHPWSTNIFTSSIPWQPDLQSILRMIDCCRKLANTMVSDVLTRVHFRSCLWCTLEWSFHGFVFVFLFFSCPQQLNRWPCHSLTD